MTTADAQQAISALSIQFENKKNINFLTQRKKALATFQEVGFPTVKHEEWKYTNLSAALLKNLDLTATNPILTITKEDVAHIVVPTELPAIHLFFANGIFQPQLSSDLNNLPKGLTLGNLENQTDSVENYFSVLSEKNKDFFTALNTAFATDGFYIKVSKGKVIEVPVYVYFVNDNRNGQVISQVRNIVVIEEAGQLQMTEITANLTEEHYTFTNNITEVFVAKEAILQHYQVQNDNEKAYHYKLNTVQQAAKSHYSNYAFQFGAAMQRHDLQIELTGEYSEGNMYGLYMLSGNSHVDNHTFIDHAVPNCQSNEFYKGILADKSKGVFNGKIMVRQDAQKTNAYQNNRNIVLSDTASIDTKPQLEIFADDVKCSHGATVGKLDQDALFYLRARGIGTEKAIAMLVQAFATDVVNYVKLTELQNYLLHIIENRLN
jgi:Fe-S cluster assembly protein SufD